jgi:hypothetical protein
VGNLDLRSHITGARRKFPVLRPAGPLHAMANSAIVLNFRTLILTFLVYVILVSVFALLAMTVVDWSKYQHLAWSGLKTVGRVTAKEPENHNFIRYSFEVGNSTFSGVGNAGGENPSFEQLNIGAPVIVYYDPEEPERSLLSNPKQQAASATAGVIFITLAGSLMSLVGLYRKKWLPLFRDIT